MTMYVQSQVLKSGARESESESERARERERETIYCALSVETTARGKTGDTDTDISDDVDDADDVDRHDIEDGDTISVLLRSWCC
jgi:hypothetical protein